MQQGNRTAILGKGLLMVLMAGVGLWTTGCFHDRDDERRGSEHAGWHERGAYNHSDSGYDRGRDGGYDHDYR
jgi:hypothetical protein